MEPVNRREFLAIAEAEEVFQAAAPELQNVDPYQMAVKAKAAIEPLIV